MANVYRAVFASCAVLLLSTVPSCSQEEGPCTGYTPHTSPCYWNAPATESEACQQFKTPCGLTDHPGQGTVQFAVIGDFGFNANGQSCEPAVGEFLKSLDEQYGLNFILTAGDDNYWHGEASTLDQNLEPYNWALDKKAPPRFFPTLGNHDWETNFGEPYLRRFAYLTNYPGGFGRYYEHEDPSGIVDLFGLNANPTEPDGITKTGKQAQWLKQALANSHAVWKIVYFHQPPFATSKHDPPEPAMNWPFSLWGASAVIMGHEHAYERILGHGIPYFIDGLGGHPWVYQITEADGCTPIKGSAARYNGGFGAMIGVATRGSINFCLYSLAKTGSACIDTQTLVVPNEERKAR